MSYTVFDTVSIFLSRFTSESIHLTDSTIDLGLDSIHLSELEFELQRVYPNAHLSHGFTLRLPTIGDIVRCVEGRLGTTTIERNEMNLERIPLSAGKLFPLFTKGFNYSVQRRILFLCRLHTENAHQFEERISFSASVIDRGRLEFVLRRIVMRHAILRTCYETERQFALSATECHFCIPDPMEISSELVDIEKEPPIRVHIQRTDHDYIVNISLHHIAVDGRSIGIFLQELKLLYNSSSSLPPKRPRQYIEDAVVREGNNNSPHHLEYWKKKLHDIGTHLLHTDYRRVSTASVEGNSYEITIPPSLMVSLHSLRRQTGSTTFAVLLSLYRLFVYKSAGFNDFPLGVMVENRNEQNRDTIGCFVNTCVLRSKLNPFVTFSQLIREVQTSLHELRDYSSVPFDDVVSAVQTDSDGSTSPLFQVLFVMDNVVVPSSNDEFRMMKNVSTTSKYEQTWYISSYGSEMSIKVEYRSNLFSEKTIRSSIGFVLYLLQRMSEEPEHRLNEISLMRPVDALQFHDQNRRNKQDYPDFNHIIRARDRLGVIRFKDNVIPMMKIQKLTRGVARVLKEAYISYYGEPNRPDDFIVIFVERSTDLVTLVLAGLEAGFCLAPISLDWSVDRRREVMTMIGSAVYISDTAEEVIPGTVCLQLSHVMERAGLIRKNRRRLLTTRLPSDLLSATFTSGTTGVAKCVCNSGDGMGNLLHNYSRLYCVGEHSSVYQVINYAFDIFFCDLFLALVNGADLTLASGAIPERREMERANTTHCFVMPAFLNFTEDAELWARMDSVLVTGETMQSRAFRKLLSAGVPLHQLYGATEQTINNTSQRLRVNSSRRGVGREYRNLTVRAVDKDVQPMPHLCPALVRYSGPGLARGIFGQLERTRSIFPPDDCLLREEELISDDSRCFDSGDLLKKGDDDNFIFVGRNDHLRKVRGRAVDLIEIEHYLSSIDQVTGCLVRLSNERLIAYVVTELSSDSLKEKLSESLPPHMIPELFVKMQRFPTNANGKIDVKTLPEPQLDTEPMVSTIEPHNELQCQLKRIFDSLLKKKISINDDFFSSGGNSLLAMLAVQRIESEMSLQLPLKQFFKLRSILKISESLQNSPTVDTSPNPIKVVPTPSFNVPLSPQQRHLWFQCAFSPESSAGDITMWLKIGDAAVTNRLHLIINTLIIANDALRTTMLIEGSLPVQYALSGTECYYCIGEEKGEKLDTHNRISIGLGSDMYILIRLHHILVDGRSLAILSEQLDLLMNGKTLTPRRSYLEYCSRSAAISYAETMRDWRDYLLDSPDLKLPVEITGKNGHTTFIHEIRVDNDRLAEYIRINECTTFHLLLSSFISTLHQLASDQTDFTIGVVHAGRTAETHEVVGLFTNTLPVRMRKVDGKMDMDTVKEMIEFPFTHCSTPLGDIVRAINPKRIAERHPLFQHVINFQNVCAAQLGGMEMSIEYEHTMETAFDTCWKVEETMEGFVVRIDYNRAMFGEEFVWKAAKLFESSLVDIIGNHESDGHSKESGVVDDIVRKSWQRHLQIESLNDDDNFFDVGGHSLTALAVINDISEAILNEVPLRLLFEYQTLGDFIHCIRQLLNDKESTVDAKKPTDATDSTKLRASYLQAPILERMLNDGSENFVRAYNITARIRMKEKIPHADIRLRFNFLLLRHPSLRTFFVFDGVFYQRTMSGTECYLPIGKPSGDEGAFDVFDTSPISVSQREDELRVCISHLIVDGHSMKTLVKELTNLEEVQHSGSTYGFGDLIRELREPPSTASVHFWKSVLSGFVFNPLRSLPRRLKARLDAGSITREDHNLGGVLHRICSTHHCTPFIVLLTSLGATLQRHSLKRDSPVSIGWPVDLRSTKTENVIGFATNTVITTVDATGTSLHELIETTSQQIISALQHRKTSFEDLLRMSGASSLFDVMLVMDPFSVEEGEGFEVIDDQQPFTKFPLTIFVHHSSRKVKITANFMKDLSTPDNISKILDDWQETMSNWATGELSPSNEFRVESSSTIVERQQRFVRVDDLQELCKPFARCRALLEYDILILEFDSAVNEQFLIDHIKLNVPLHLHPDELRSCSFEESIPSSLPLSPQQLQMYFLSLQDASGHYNVPFVQRFNITSVNAHHLVLALHHVRQSNEALRTMLLEVDGEPVQIILSATESYYCIEPMHLSEEEVNERLHSDSELKMNILDTCARLRLFDTGEELLLFLVISHVICDGWSTSLMQTQLSSVYEELQSGETPLLVRRRSWKEYESTLHNDYHSVVINENYLNNVIEGLPTEDSKLEVDDGVVIHRFLHLDRASATEVKKRAVFLGTTPFIVIMQAITKSIHTVFGIEKVNIGTPVTNRSLSTIDVIGCFMNTLVIPVDCTVSSATIQSALNLNVPNFEVLKAIRTRLQRADIRLFDVFVNCRYGMESERNVRVEGVKKTEVHKMSPIYPLEIYVEEENGGFEIKVKMKKGNEETIERLVEALRTNLCNIDSANSTKPPMETTWTSEIKPEDIPDLDLASLLYRNSILNCDDIALQTSNRKLSYGELWDHLTQRAEVIRQLFFTTTGEILKADDVIGVWMEHGQDAILTCLSILVAGAAYLPLLHNWPDERVRHAVEETRCGLVLSDGSLKNFNRKIVRWRRRNLSEDAAYVIYTSGTTGKPKGVVAVHRGVVNMLNYTIRNLSMRGDDVAFQFTKFVFDNSILEIWLALASGATLFIDDSPFTHNRFISTLHKYRITHALLFPGLVAAFTDDQLVHLYSLRAWCMGAEKASQPLVDRAIEKGINIVQVYGPTETTTYALSRFMKRGDHANNLGKAVPNTRLRVNFNGDKTGELFVGGEGLMRGYVGRTRVYAFNDSDTTIVFRRDESFTNGYYATGDVVQVQEDDTVIFMGRNDSQVKVRGYRVELNEVENVLLRFVEQVKVLLFEEQQQLIAFIKSSLTADQLRGLCAQVLPDYQIPSRFIFLVRFPLTDNSKVDVSKLREMVNRRLSRDKGDRGDETISLRFKNVLKSVGFRFVSLSDNFTEMGGQSITAMRLIAEIEREFGVTIYTHELYRSKTLQGIIPLISRENTRSPESKNCKVMRNRRESSAEMQRISDEEKIRRIWSSLLGAQVSFTDDDNFFLVGGDSFMLLKLHNKLIQEFTIDLSLADLLRHLTISQQLKMLTSRNTGHSSLIRIANPTGPKGTLILLHPLIGGVQMPYRNLISQLGSDFEIIGFEHPQTFKNDSTTPQFETLESLIQSYVRSHHSALTCSTGKRVFIGASLGALLAFEMATQLDIETDVIVIDGTSNRIQTSPLAIDDHRSKMNDILKEYKVNDETLIHHMIDHSWLLYRLSRDYKPTRNERISVHVFSCCETDLNWSDIALVKSVRRLKGGHSHILNHHNSSLIAHFTRSLCHNCNA